MNDTQKTVFPWFVIIERGLVRPVTTNPQWWEPQRLTLERLGRIESITGPFPEMPTYHDLHQELGWYVVLEDSFGTGPYAHDQYFGWRLRHGHRPYGHDLAFAFGPLASEAYARVALEQLKPLLPFSEYTVGDVYGEDEEIETQGGTYLSYDKTALRSLPTRPDPVSDWFGDWGGTSNIAPEVTPDA